MKKKSEVICVMRALVADFRSAVLFNDNAFASICLADIQRLFKQRHSIDVKFEEWPVCL